MLKHYTNTLEEDAQEGVDQLIEIGLDASVGRPRETEAYCVERLEGLGVAGIYITVADNETRTGDEIVNEAWNLELQREEK